MNTENNTSSFAQNEVIQTIKRHKKPIGIISFLGAVVGLLLTIFSKPVDEAKAVLIIPLSLPTAGELGDIFGVGKANPIDILQGIVESRKITKALANKFGIPEKEIMRYFSAEPDPKKNQLAIVTRLPGKGRAVAMNELSIQLLRKLMREVSQSKSSNLISQIQTLKDKAEQDVLDVENRLLTLQSRLKSGPDPKDPTASGTLKLIRETEVRLDVIRKQLDIALKQAQQLGKIGITLPTGLPPVTDGRNKIIQLELDLEIARIQYGDTHPQVERLRQQLQISKAKLNDEIGNYLLATQSNLDPKTGELVGQKELLEWQLQQFKKMYQYAPKESLDLTNLTAELDIRTAALKEITAKYEKARVEGVVDAIQWTVLSPPEVTPDSPVNKRWIRTPLTDATLAFLFASALYFVLDLRKKRS